MAMTFTDIAHMGQWEEEWQVLNIGRGLATWVMMWPWLPLNSCLKGQGPGLEAGNDIITSWGEVGTDKKQNQTKQKTKKYVETKTF